MRRQQFLGLQRDQAQQFRVGHVGLVDEHNQVLDAHLTREQHVFPRLRLGALRTVDEQDGAVHLGGAGDHVLHEVGVTGAVDVRVVPCGRLVLDVRQVDGDATDALLGRAVDLRAGEGAPP